MIGQLTLLTDLRGEDLVLATTPGSHHPPEVIFRVGTGTFTADKVLSGARRAYERGQEEALRGYLEANTAAEDHIFRIVDEGEPSNTSSIHEDHVRFPWVERVIVLGIPKAHALAALTGLRRAFSLGVLSLRASTQKITKATTTGKDTVHPDWRITDTFPGLT